jgi:hypothetical protein
MLLFFYLWNFAVHTGPALQQADALLTSLRRTLLSYAAPWIFKIRKSFSRNN